MSDIGIPPVPQPRPMPRPPTRSDMERVDPQMMEVAKFLLVNEKTLDGLVGVVEKFVAWNEKYPSDRVYSHHVIVQIAKELDEINAEAVAVLAKVK